MTKHTPTPGPWVQDIDALVFGANGLRVADCICDGQDQSDDEIEANACLIAAAPELLEALALLCDQIDSLHGQSSCIDEDLERGKAYRLAQAALAKAKGGAA